MSDPVDAYVHCASLRPAKQEDYVACLAFMFPFSFPPTMFNVFVRSLFAECNHSGFFVDVSTLTFLR